MTTTNHFSLKLSQHLSSLIPGFEGHWNYIKWKDGIILACWDKMVEMSAYPERLIICPAWQVEDVLRNLDKLNGEFCKVYPSEIAEKIAKCFFFYSTDTAYQKIEEYLWKILGHSRSEECISAHCKCMQNDCANHHYNDHKK